MLVANVVKIIDSCTVKVVIMESKMHPLYKKVVYSKKYFMCHYTGDANIDVGMKVGIIPCRPYSKKKKHCVVSVAI